MTPVRWFRVVFYPCVALLGAFLLWGGPGVGKDKDTATVLHGETAQRAPLRMVLDARGRPASFETTIDSKCTGGRTWWFRWKASDGQGVDFQFRDGRLEVVHRGSELYSDGKYGEWELTMTADVDDDRSAVEGTVTLVERFRTPERERYTCESGGVRFSARR